MKFQELSSAQKAAILIRFLGEETAAEIFRNMTLAEVKKVGGAVAGLGRVPEGVVEQVLAEFLVTLEKKRPPLQGGAAQTEQFLRRAVKGERGEQLADGINTVTDELRSVLAQFEDRLLVALLVKEHPQTAALILAHLVPARAAALLKDLPESLQGTVMVRLAQLQPVSADSLSDLLETLETELGKSAGRTAQVGGIDTIVKMLSAMDEVSEGKFLEQLEERDPHLASEVKERLFTFSDLVQLDSRSMQKVVSEVSDEVIVLALRGSALPLQNHFYANMSGRKAEQIRQDLTELPPQPKSKVEEARAKILQRVEQLKQEGIVVIERQAG